MIAFLGTGLMGSGFVSALLARGEAVTVWNRTISRTAPLAAEGALVADSPAAAVRGASHIHLALLDDAAVDEVLDNLLSVLEPGAVIVDHSTTAVQSTEARALRLQAGGVKFLHAPVFMGPSNARNSTGAMLVAGPRAIFDEVRPELEWMTGKLRYLGERPDLAAVYKLCGNMFLMFVASGIADVLSFARGLGVDPEAAMTVFDDFNPATQVAARGQRMAKGEFSPAAFELVAARKDIRLMLDSIAKAGASLHVVPAIAERFDRVIEAGYGQDDLAAVAAADVS
jgi:3-hydroxyisobutyrate dehydrogenase-like beta-hydroxyacid dehydrogenase